MFSGSVNISENLSITPERINEKLSHIYLCHLTCIKPGTQSAISMVLVQIILFFPTAIIHTSHSLNLSSVQQKLTLFSRVTPEGHSCSKTVFYLMQLKREHTRKSGYAQSSSILHSDFPPFSWSVSPFHFFMRFSRPLTDLYSIEDKLHCVDSHHQATAEISLPI